MSASYQTVEQREPVDRTRHVWMRAGKRRFKCVLCGGVSSEPSMEGLPEKFERLTAREKELCLKEK